MAGIGGPVALKGSDGEDRQRVALARGAQPGAALRAQAFLEHLYTRLAPATHSGSLPDSVLKWVTAPAPMGGQCFSEAGITAATVAATLVHPTSGEDTRRLAQQMVQAGVDLLIFVGGDGTARDILAGVGERVPVLGIPAGVKMHSGVFAVTPRTAAALVAELLVGGWVAPVSRAVRDFEEAGSKAEVQLKTYGELRVPEIGGYLQQTKIGGRESEPLAVADICAEVLECLPLDRDIVIGAGSTCSAIKSALGLSDPTLLGIDVRTREGVIRHDLRASQLLELPRPYVVMSFTRGQGFLLGRGNQQLSAAFLRRLSWPEDVLVVGTRTKLSSLQQRPLLIDTGDDELDERLGGLVEVVTGYADRLLYRVGTSLS